MRNSIKTCNGKNCYGKNEAWKVKLAVEKRRNRRMRLYAHECGWWHITSERD